MAAVLDEHAMLLWSLRFLSERSQFFDAFTAAFTATNYEYSMYKLDLLPCYMYSCT